MAAKFRKVDPRLWTDEKFRSLIAEERLLALWLLTCSRLNRCGIVLWSPGLASEETGIHATRIEAVCDTVCDTVGWVRDTVSRTVFLTRWWRYNQPDNVKALQGALSDLHDVPKHNLKSALVDAMKDLKPSFHTVYMQALDTVSDTVSVTVSAQEQEQEQEKKKEQKDIGRKRPAGFSAPTIDEVQAYCDERGNGIDPEAFVACYAAQGWRLANGNPVKDWKSCVITWEKRSEKEAAKARGASRCPTPEDLANWNPTDGGLGYAS